MRTFTDLTGITWNLCVNVTAAKRVRTLLNVDLMEIATGSLLQKLGGDPVLLCDIVYVLCKEQADGLKITDEDFGRRMAGDTIQAATDAFLDEVIDFFPGSRRELLKKALRQSRGLDLRMVAAAEKKLDGIYAEAESRLASAGS